MRDKKLSLPTLPTGSYILTYKIVIVSGYYTRLELNTP